MRWIGIRDLLKEVTHEVRRAMAGEGMVIRIFRTPAARLGPLNHGSEASVLEDLIAAGLVRPPRRSAHRKPPTPVVLPGDGSVTNVVLAERGD